MRGPSFGMALLAALLGPPSTASPQEMAPSEPFLAVYGEAAADDTAAITLALPATGERVAVRAEPILRDTDLTSAAAATDSAHHTHIVRVGLTPAAAARLGAATRALVGRRLVVVVDGRVHQVITVRSPIEVQRPIALLTPATREEAAALERRLRAAIRERLRFARHDVDLEHLVAVAGEVTVAAIRHVLWTYGSDGQRTPVEPFEAVLAPEALAPDVPGRRAVNAGAEGMAQRAGLLLRSLQDMVPCDHGGPPGCTPRSVRLALRYGRLRPVDGRFVVTVERIELSDDGGLRPVRSTLYDVVVDLTADGWVAARSDEVGPL